MQNFYPLIVVLTAKEIINIISKAAVCQGNSDERFLALPSIRKNSMKDSTSTSQSLYSKHYNVFALSFSVVDSTRTGVPSIYHINCEVLLPQAMASSRCEFCKKHRKSLCALASSHNNKDQTDDVISTVSSECPNICESTDSEQPNQFLSINTSKRLCTITELQDGLEKYGSIPSGMLRYTGGVLWFIAIL